MSSNFKIYDPVEDVIAKVGSGSGGGGGVPSTGGTFTGDVAMQAPAKITQSAPPTGPSDLVNKAYVDQTFLPLAGGSMTGNLVMSGATEVIQCTPPSTNCSLTNKQYVDQAIANSTSAVPNATPTVLGKIQLGGDLNGVGTTATAPLIANNVVSAAKLKISAPSRIFGSNNVSSTVQELTVGTGLEITSAGVLQANVTSVNLTNSLTSANNQLISNVSGCEACLTPALGTISQSIGFDATGVLVKADATNVLSSGGNNIQSNVNGKSGNLVVPQAIVATTTAMCQIVGFNSTGALVRANLNAVPITNSLISNNNNIFSNVGGCGSNIVITETVALADVCQIVALNATGSLVRANLNAIPITNSLISATNQLISNVGGCEACLTPALGTISQTIGFDAAGALVKTNVTNVLSSGGNNIQSNVNGKSGNLVVPQAVVATSTAMCQIVGFNSTGALVRANLNAVPIANSLTSADNNIFSNVSGSGSNLTIVETTALVDVCQIVALNATGSLVRANLNAIPITNSLTGTNNQLVSNVGGCEACLTPALGTINQTIGFDAVGALVKTNVTNVLSSGGNNIQSNVNGKIGNLVVPQAVVATSTAMCQIVGFNSTGALVRANLNAVPITNSLTSANNTITSNVGGCVSNLAAILTTNLSTMLGFESTGQLAYTSNFVRKVNGFGPDVNGDIAVVVGQTTTGPLSGLPIPPGTLDNGDIYIVSGDPTPSNNGRTYIYDGANWQEITTNQAATDARYILKGGDTLNAGATLTIPSTSKITIIDAAVNPTDAMNLATFQNKNAGLSQFGTVKFATNGDLIDAGPGSNTGVARVKNASINSAKMSLTAPSRIFGSNNATNTVQELTLGSGLEVTSAGVLQANSLTAGKAGETVFGVVQLDPINSDLIDFNGPAANSGIPVIGPNKVTYAKMQQIAGAKTLLGSQAGGVVTEIGLNTLSGIDMVGNILTLNSSSILKAGATQFGVVQFNTTGGDLVQNSANSGIAQVKALAITNAKMANMTAVSQLKGSNASSNTVTDIVLGSGLLMNGSTLETTVQDATTTSKGVVQLAGDLGGVGTTATAPVITNSAVTYAKMQNVAGAKTLLGSQAGGVVAEIGLNTASGIDMVGSTLTLNSSSIQKAGTAQFGVVEFDSSGDLVQTGANSGIGLVKPLAITNAKMANMTAVSQLKGSGATSNVATDITLGTGLCMTGSTLSVTVAPTSDATTTSKGVVQLAGDLGGVGTTATAPVISNSAVTYTKMQNVAGAKTLLGSQTASGTVSEIGLNTASGIDMVGNTLTLNSSSMQKAGTTQFGVVEFDPSGDLIQTSANSGIANIGTNKVTYTKIQQIVGAKKLLGSQTATTNVAEIGLDNGLDMIAGNLSVSYPNVPISASTSVTAGNTVYLVNTASAVTLTLPAASSVSKQLIFVKDSAGSANTNNVTVQSAGGLIDNVTSLVISKNYGSIIFYSNGTNWYAVSFNNIDIATVSLAYAGYFYNGGSIALPNGSDLAINIASFASLINPLVNISQSAAVFTIQQNGRFTITLSVTQNGGTAGNFTLLLYKGASTLLAKSNVSYGFPSGYEYNMNVTWAGLLNASETVTVKYATDSNTGGSNIRFLNFSIIQLPINI